MSAKPTYLNDSLYQYLLANSLREHPLLKELREETASLPGAEMQISPEQGQFIQLLIKLINAKNTIEIGVFTGYSSLCVALALPENGKVIACDMNAETTKIAKKYWEKANVLEKINFCLAPAQKTLTTLLEKHEHNNFDFAFIDADKANYDFYYEVCLQLIKPQGLILIDNTLWGGDVLDQTDQSISTESIRKLNKKIHHDVRVEMSLLPVGDGLTLILKK